MINQFFADLGFRALTDEEALELSALATETIRNRIMIRLAEYLNTEDMAYVMALMKEEKTLAQLSAFLQTRQINLNQLLDEEVTSYQGELTAAKDWLAGND